MKRRTPPPKVPRKRTHPPRGSLRESAREARRHDERLNALGLKIRDYWKKYLPGSTKALIEKGTFLSHVLSLQKWADEQREKLEGKLPPGSITEVVNDVICIWKSLACYIQT